MMSKTWSTFIAASSFRSPAVQPSSNGIKLNMVTAKWINLLSPDLGITPPCQIVPPRSGAVSFAADDVLFTFGGYAEKDSAAVPDRFVVNDLWKFTPYAMTETSSSWGWTKIEQDPNSYTPGPRLATAMAALPSLSSSILLGGWDPQEPGTGGIILDDVSVLDVNTLQWSQPISSEQDDDGIISIPGGPTSRHVAVPVCINNGESIILHNHRCENHVLMLSVSSSEGQFRGKWKRQPTTGNIPSSRGLHCAAPLNYSNSITKSVVIFGGAAKDGKMSNEAFVLDLNTWEWKKLLCTGDQPSPRAGACLCPLDEKTVILFGGAETRDGGLVGLNDVWTLSINIEKGLGVWKCLLKEQADDITCPPGRNAATLTKMNAQALLPRALTDNESLLDKEPTYFLLQGGWNPFRKTYNDVFVLCILPE